MPWQIVPVQVWDRLRGDDPARVQRVTAALWQMDKLDLAELERGRRRRRCGRGRRNQVSLPRSRPAKWMAREFGKETTSFHGPGSASGDRTEFRVAL